LKGSVSFLELFLACETKIFINFIQIFVGLQAAFNKTDFSVNGLQ